ncbi:MAG: Ig-like domain-containing protein [Bacteroidaceae bacterium]|nr:Ig-like domain-containing protein [Bacteroidaceae bacterium]
MKRLQLFVMMLFSVSCLLAGTTLPDKTVNLTMTKGETIHLIPYEDAGIGVAVMKSQHTISDPDAFYITPERHEYYSGTRWFYTYTLTANVVGYYVFSEDILWEYSGGEWTTITYNITVVDVTAITLPPTKSVYLGESYTFAPIITDNGATTTLTWQSTDQSVATIDSDGKLTTVGIGVTTIICTAHNGVSAQCEVTVVPRLVNSITLNVSETELITGEQLLLEATVLPDNATNKSVNWSSSNSAVAVVNENGLVTAVGAGLCNITAGTKDGSELTTSCLVKVLGNVMFCEDLGAVTGATIMLPVQLTNADAIQGFEFELALPEGVSVEADGSGKLMATMTDRVSTSGLDGARLDNGNYKFVFTSTNRIMGSEGAIMNVPLVVAENAELGSHPIVVKNVELVKYGTSAQIHHSDRKATLTIKEMTMGDVNGDGNISVADAIAIINYVLGRTPVSFISRAADVNGDNSISLADAVAVVDIILGRSGNNVKAAIHSLMQIPE